MIKLINSKYKMNSFSKKKNRSSITKISDSITVYVWFKIVSDYSMRMLNQWKLSLPKSFIFSHHFLLVNNFYFFFFFFFFVQQGIYGRNHSHCHFFPIEKINEILRDFVRSKLSTYDILCILHRVLPPSEVVCSSGEELTPNDVVSVCDWVSTHETHGAWKKKLY